MLHQTIKYWHTGRGWNPNIIICLQKECWRKRQTSTISQIICQWLFVEFGDTTTQSQQIILFIKYTSLKEGWKVPDGQSNS